MANLHPVDDELVDAGIDDQPQRFPLESKLGGWVEIRPMSYGDQLTRRDLAMKVSAEMAGRNQSQRMDLQMVNVETTAFDYAKCIVHHNLRNPRTGRAFQFGNKTDWFGSLDPIVGQEIDKYIAQKNGFPEVDFTPRPSDGSSLAMAPSPPRQNSSNRQ